MKVFVTGATGAIGRFVVPQLVAAGHDVTGLARTAEKARQLEAMGATPAAVSLYDWRQLEEAFAGHDAVANLATSIPPVAESRRASAWAENDRVRTEGSAAVARAAASGGVRRLIQESITFMYPDSGDAWISEDVELDAPRAIAAAAVAERNAVEAGGTVLRFAAFYGPGSVHTDVMRRWAGRHVATVVGRAGGYVSSVHLHDAGTAVVAALDAPAGVYNVSDDEPMTKREFAAALGRAVGRRPWIRVPGRVARFGGPAMTALMRSHRISNARFKQATGWAPRYRSVREGLVGSVVELSRA